MIIDCSPEEIWSKCKIIFKPHFIEGYFITWIMSTHAVDLENGILYVVTHNQDGKEWLDGNLKDLAQSTLQEILQKPTKVSFDVVSYGNDKDQPIHDEVLSYESINLEEITYSLDTLIVRSDRRVVFPKYLFRWAQYAGSQFFWLIIAFRQARFLATVKGSREKSFSVDASEIFKWCGVSRATFWRLMDHDIIKTFVQKQQEKEWVIDRSSGKIKQKANSYQMPIDIPLLPTDVDALSYFLLKNGLQQDPIQALNKAMETPIHQILFLPIPHLKVHINTPVSHRRVEDLVKDLIGQELTPEIQRLSKELEDHIIRPDDCADVSWYFLQEWLPFLGSDPALFITYLRSQTYYNPATGESRDMIWIEGGYKSIADLIGMDNPHAVIEWFPGLVGKNSHREKDVLLSKSQQQKERITKLRSLISSFIQRIDSRPDGQRHYAYLFKIEKATEPLTPDDVDFRKCLHDILDQCNRKKLFPHLKTLLDQVQFESINSKYSNNDQSGFETLKDILVSGFETLKNTNALDLRRSNSEPSGYETLYELLVSGFETISHYSALDLRRLKILDSLKTLNPLLNINTTTRSQDFENNGHDEPVGEEWNIDKLLVSCRIHPKNHEKIKVSVVDIPLFVSWILKANCKQGKEIYDPVALAISSMTTNPKMGAGLLFETLAQKGPRYLKRLIEDELAFRNPQDSDWRLFADQTTHEKTKGLLQILGLDDS